MGVCFPPQPGIRGLDPRIKIDLLLICGLAFPPPPPPVPPACSYLNKNWGGGLLGTRKCPGGKEAGRLSGRSASGAEVRGAESHLDHRMGGTRGPEFPATAQLFQGPLHGAGARRPESLLG